MMGIKQYIREQKHRQDIIGELARTLISPSIAIDYNSKAFRMAEDEFNSCNRWTRDAAIRRLNNDINFQRIVKLDSEISKIITDAIRIQAHRGYNHCKEYSRLKSSLEDFVGNNARVGALQNSYDFQAMLNIINDLLPPDRNMLYPDGFLEDIEIDL